jgi:hypothetical protein
MLNLEKQRLSKRILSYCAKMGLNCIKIDMIFETKA